MRQINLLIFHTDKEYAAALGRSLALKDTVYAITLAADAKPCLSAALEKVGNKKYDMVIVDREWKEQAEHDGSLNRERLIGLTETPAPEDGKGYIYKYGGLDRISSELQIAYAELTGRSRIFLPGRKTRFIGFTSGAGGVGTSCIAISTGRELTSIKKRDALYLSFEETESTPVYIPVDEGRASISEYLYYLFAKEKENIASYIDSFLITDTYGLCAFRPSKGINELSGLSCEMLMAFLDSLYNSGRFQNILMDFHAHISTKTENLMKCCHKVFLIDDGRPLSLWKNQRFIESISPEAYEEIQQRISPVTNKWEPSLGDIPDDNRIFTEYDEESFALSGTFIDVSLQRCFGLGVRRIADELATETTKM